MILNIFRGHVDASDKGRFLDHVRDHSAARSMALPGLQSFQPAWREVGDELEVVLVSTWDSFVSITALGRDLDEPISLPGSSGMLRAGHADHYELVTGSLRGMALGDARVRILRGVIAPNLDASFFDWARTRLDALMEDSRLLGVHLGRRMNADAPEAVQVSIWREADILDVAMQRQGAVPVAPEEEAQGFLTDDWSLDEYEAVTLAPPAASAPALLMADDQRRYFYATPAAARLTGYSVARLTSMSIEDLALPELAEQIGPMWTQFLATGEQEGPFVVVCHDGSSREVTYHARANTPWPGAHTSLLVPTSDQALPDFDAALVMAGVVARHPVQSADLAVS